MHNFSGSDGNFPGAALVDVKGKNGKDTLYGTTAEGGTNGLGTVFSIKL